MASLLVGMLLLGTLRQGVMASGQAPEQGTSLGCNASADPEIELLKVSFMQVSVRSLQVKSSQTAMKIPPPIEACSAQSHVFQEDPRPRSQKQNRTFARVIAPGIMSSGSTWFRQLIEEASDMPTCAIYPSEGCMLPGLEAFCKKGVAGGGGNGHVMLLECSRGATSM